MIVCVFAQYETQSKSKWKNERINATNRMRFETKKPCHSMIRFVCVCVATSLTDFLTQAQALLSKHV